ncbi:MAG: ABC transporter permease [Fimbriimonadaceae bacterium]|nr:ABC transporter permease [Fimbriimonadaceae bacterium]
MTFASAWTSLRDNWKNSLLSASGVAIGSIAILLLVSIGLGVEQDISGQVEDLGANVLVVVAGHIDPNLGFNPNLNGQSYFRDEDGARLATVNGVKNVATLNFAGGGVKRGEKSVYPLMIACTPNWFTMHGAKLESGSFITPQNESQPVAVLGAVAKNALFPEEDPIGKEVVINQVTYKVVGHLKDMGDSEGMFSMTSFQNVAYVPYAFLKSKNPDLQIDRFMVQSEPTADPKVLVPALQASLGERLDTQQYSVLTQEDLLGLIYKVMGILGTLVVGLTGIALFVGGVGIMTVMLMSVNERRVEIGVRMAVGAQPAQIFSQFLFEAILIGILGSMFGLVFSSVVNTVLANTTSIKPLMTPGTVLLAFGVGIGIGAIFGVIPAIRASKADPVVSLRNL